jgi:hypothetical protein
MCVAKQTGQATKISLTIMMSPSAFDASVPRAPFDCELIATAPAQTEHAERGEHQAGQPSADYRAGDGRHG